MIALGVVEFTRVEKISKGILEFFLAVLISNFSIQAVAWGRRKFPPLSNDSNDVNYTNYIISINDISSH